jgi:hypothetical protein
LPAGPSACSTFGRTGAAGHPATVAFVGAMVRRKVSLGVVAWIVVGVIVAARDGFLDDLGSLSNVLSAVLAVAVWPLVLLDVRFGV